MTFLAYGVSILICVIVSVAHECLASEFDKVITAMVIRSLDDPT